MEEISGLLCGEATPPQVVSGRVLPYLRERVFDQGASQASAKTELAQFLAQHLERLPRYAQEQVLEEAVAAFSAREFSFEEEVASARERWAALLQAREDWSGAARVLAAINFQPRNRSIGDAYRLGLYIRIVRLFLEDDDPVAAEGFLSRAALLLPDCTDALTHHAFKVCQARILDARRSFVQAAQRYAEVAAIPGLDAGERRQALQAAVVCSILAGPSAVRSATVAALHEAETRSPGLGLGPGILRTLLAKVHRVHIIRPHEAAELRALLAPHHLALLSDGRSTVADRAVTEHNVLAASRLYDSLSLARLASLLRLREDEAEEIAVAMISQERMHGEIDGVDGVIHFQKPDPVLQMDEYFRGALRGVEDACHAVARAFPECA